MKETFIESDRKESPSEVEYYVEALHLSPEMENTSKRRFRITDSALDEKINKKRESPIDLRKTEDLERFFEGYERIKPESVLRPPGESTVFTTAGVQRVESMLREHEEIIGKKFFVTQPVIRSQYMDSVKEGFSTSFIDVSIEHIDAKRDDFFEVYKTILALLLNQGVSQQDIHVTVGTSTDQWGKKKVTKETITFYVGNIEVAECVYVPDYPLDASSTIAIADGCFGMERFCWGTGKHQYYHQDFNQFYDPDHKPDEISAIIDAVRTGVLIAREGVAPSHKDPGYRLRQCMTRFFLRNKSIGLNAKELVSAAYQYWSGWDERQTTDEEVVSELVQKEIDRAHNVFFLHEFKRLGGPDIYLDVNQNRSSFIEQLKRSRPDQMDIIQETLKEI